MPRLQRALVALAVLLVLAAPSALAQPVSPTLEMRAEPALLLLDPGANDTVKLLLTYRSPVPLTHTTTVRLAAREAPAAVVAVFEPAEVVVPAGESRVTAAVALHIALAPDTRGGQEWRMTLVAEAPGTTLHDRAEAEQPLVLQTRDARTASTNATPPPPQARAPPPASSAATASAPAASEGLFAPYPPQGLTTQTAHNEGFTGGESVALALFGAAGAYAGSRLRRRLG